MTEPEFAECKETDLTTHQSAPVVFAPTDGSHKQIPAVSDLISTDQIDRVSPSSRRTVPTLSASRLAFYLLASTVVASILTQLLTDDEMLIFFGTLSLAIISAWIWAWLRKIRLTLQYFSDTQQSRSDQPLLGELRDARRQ